MAKDAGDSQTNVASLLREFNEERAAIQRERNAVLHIDEIASQTHGLIARVLKRITRGQWLIACLIAGVLIAALLAGREVFRFREFEHVAIERFNRIDEKLERGISIRVEEFETLPFIEGKANCESSGDYPNPCLIVCVNKSGVPSQPGARCEQISALAQTMQDAVVVIIAGGHDGKRLSASARETFGSNDGLALARASSVRDALTTIWGKRAFRKSLDPNYILMAKDTRGPNSESPEDRTVDLTVIRAVEAPR